MTVSIFANVDKKDFPMGRTQELPEPNTISMECIEVFTSSATLAAELDHHNGEMIKLMSVGAALESLGGTISPNTAEMAKYALNHHTMGVESLEASDDNVLKRVIISLRRMLLKVIAWVVNNANKLILVFRKFARVAFDRTRVLKKVPADAQLAHLYTIDLVELDKEFDIFYEAILDGDYKVGEAFSVGNFNYTFSFADASGKVKMISTKRELPKIAGTLTNLPGYRDSINAMYDKVLDKLGEVSAEVKTRDADKYGDGDDYSAANLSYLKQAHIRSQINKIFMTQFTRGMFAELDELSVVAIKASNDYLKLNNPGE